MTKAKTISKSVAKAAAKVPDMSKKDNDTKRSSGRMATINTVQKKIEEAVQKLNNAKKFEIDAQKAQQQLGAEINFLNGQLDILNKIEAKNASDKMSKGAKNKKNDIIK